MEWNNNEETAQGESTTGASSGGAGVGSHDAADGSHDHDHGSHRKGKSVLFSLLAVLLIVASALWIASYLGVSFRPLAATGGANEWKAVFLTNGQVYFGKVRNEQSDPLVLSDIYYLQVQQQLQPVQPGQQPQSQQQLTLIKFGNELHGPQDEMRVVRRNVLYIESLKDSGRVVEAINRYIADQEADDTEE